MCLFLVKSEGATLFASPSHLSLLTSLSPMQLTDSQLLRFSHSSGDSIQNLLPLLYSYHLHVSLCFHPFFRLQNPDHFLLSVLSSAVSLLTLPTCKHDQNVNHKKGLNSMFPLKESRSSPSSHDSFKCYRNPTPLMQSQPAWHICLHYFHFLTSVICQFTAIWLWLSLLQ